MTRKNIRRRKGQKQNRRTIRRKNNRQSVSKKNRTKKKMKVRKITQKGGTNTMPLPIKQQQLLFKILIAYNIKRPEQREIISQLDYLLDLPQEKLVQLDYLLGLPPDELPKRYKEK